MEDELRSLRQGTSSRRRSVVLAGGRIDGSGVERDEEFARFVDERWPVLVRSAVLLGCTAPEAEDLVQTALVRCYVAWEKVSRAGNRDGYVYRVLVNCHHDSHRRRGGGSGPRGMSRRSPPTTPRTRSTTPTPAGGRCAG